MANINFTLVPAKVMKDGTNKVRLYISHHSKVKYITTDVIVRNDQWRNGSVVNHPHAKQMNLRLTQLMGKYLNALYSIENPDSFSCDQIADILSGDVDVMHRTISYAKAEFLKQYTETGRNTTAQILGNTIDNLIVVIGDVELVTISHESIKKFHKWMVKVKRYSNTTQNIQLVNVRTFLNFCINENLVQYKDKPFDGIKLPKCSRRDTQISVDELKAIRDIKSKSVTMNAMRDIFMLSFFLGGMNVCDLMRLDFRGDYIRFRRQKIRNRTNHWTTIPILPEAREIINRNMNDDGTLCFGKYNTYEKVRNACSNNMDLLSKSACIGTPFMFYSARKTFVQIGVKQMIPVNILEYCTGETPKNLNPIASYYVIDKEIAETAMRKIFDVLVD